MSRIFTLSVVLVALLSCAPERDAAEPESIDELSAAATSASITHGPVLGQPRPSSVRLWLRTNQSSTVMVQWADNSSFNNPSSQSKDTLSGSDFTAKFLVQNLTANTTYWYRIHLDGVLQSGVFQFKTAPSSTTAGFRMAVFSDFTKNVAIPALASMDSLTPRPDIIAFLGDLDHSTPGKDLDPSQTDVALDKMRTMHKYLKKGTGANSSVFGAAFEQYFVARPGVQYPLLHVWDDHDYGINNGDRNFVFRAQAMKAYDEYFIKASREDADPSEGLWQLQSYGAADIFILDARSERDPNKDIDDAGYLRGTTTPATMLGPTQKTWLKDNLLASTRAWKIILSGVPFNPGCKDFDAWGLFDIERQEIVDFIRSNGIPGVVIVSGDIHSGGAIDDGSHSGFPEISVPHANLHCFGDTWVPRNQWNCDSNPTPCELGDHCGTWSDGLLCGYESANGNDKDGYVLLDVSSTQLTMEVRAANNKVRKQRVLTL